LLYFVGLRG